MKRSMCLLSGVLCLFLVSCRASVQDNSYREEDVNQEIQIEQTVQDEVADELPSGEEVELWDEYYLLNHNYYNLNSVNYQV